MRMLAVDLLGVPVVSEAIEGDLDHLGPRPCDDWNAFRRDLNMGISGLSHRDRAYALNPGLSTRRPILRTGSWSAATLPSGFYPPAIAPSRGIGGVKERGATGANGPRPEISAPGPRRRRLGGSSRPWESPESPLTKIFTERDSRGKPGAL